ncbi:MAG: adenylate/guanylate cyclase protein [Burkholderiales bacterium]|jgi:class 3 adenylate cyclase|nr:adenylate/guanylate cyclase protein [Burkholderiales bacterium]
MATNEMSVLFADISGSTKLYDTLGDTRAKALVDECIGIMRSIVARYKGRVIKTIGDEVMCILPDADSGHLAATDMQLKVASLEVVANVRRAIRVGFHFGAVIEENGDVFGDTVNMAARMAGLAKGMQIITTRATVDRLSPALRSSTRGIAALSVKGKGDDVDVCEVIWQSGEDLTMATASIAQTAKAVKLQLKHGAKEFVLEQANSGIAVGRDASCQIVLADRMASRVHARIERRRDKFFLVDQSTNGTFVNFVGEVEIVLRREEVMLRGQGRVTFGHSLSESAEETLDFVVQS